MSRTFEEKMESGLPEAWRPDQEDPETLIGTVTGIEWGTSEYQESGRYPIVLVETEDGQEKAVHAFHSVLLNELLRQKPQPGEKIGIKYLGKIDTKPGSKYKSFIGYRVRVDRDSDTFDWGDMSAPHVDEPVDQYQDAQYEDAAADDDIPF